MTHSAADPEVRAFFKPLSILSGTNHQVSVYKNGDRFRFTVADLNGKQLAPNLKLTELAYEYPELHTLVISKLAE